MAVWIGRSHLLHMANSPTFRLWSALCSALSVSLAACAGGTSSATQAPVARVDTVVVRAAADAELEQRVATLQLQLLERTAQVDNVQRQLEGARQEVVRQMARLQTLASRADAASAMAEAEIGVETLGALRGDEEVPEAAEARHFLELSTTEFAGENYAGALYLASQARSLARGAEFRLTNAEQGGRQAGEVSFALPVPLETVRRANVRVRAGPGLTFRVVVTLDPGTPLVGHSYTEQWVRITDDQGREGWIFHDLVASPRAGLQ